MPAYYHDSSEVALLLAVDIDEQKDKEYDLISEENAYLALHQQVPPRAPTAPPLQDRPNAEVRHGGR